MDFSKPYIRGLMLNDFKSRQKTAESALHINSAFDEDRFSKRRA